MSHESRVQYRVFSIGLQDRQFATPLGDEQGRAVVVAVASASSSSDGAWTNYRSGDALIGAAGLVISAAPGRLRSITGVNTSTTTSYYLVGVDKAIAPVNGDDALFAIPLQDASSNFAGSGNGLDFGVDGMFFGAGIAYAISTTPQIVTLAAASTVAVFARYL